MKIEKLSMVNGKKMFLIGFIVCLIFVIIVSLLTSKAKYQNSETVKIVEGKVNYVVPDLNVMAVYLKNDKEYVTSKEIPKSGYVLSSDSYCTVPDNEERIKEDITYRDGKVYIGINKKGTKCYLYFNSLADVTLAKLNQKSNGNKESFDGIADTNEGIYSASDGMYGGISYYYRGAVENNYVHFAGFYWRIIRINGDGSLRLIYDGTTKHNNGESSEDRQIGTKEYNSSFNDNMYVGFKYESDKKQGNKDPNIILGLDSNPEEGTLNKWYEENIKNKQLESYIEKNAIFCNDRRSSTTKTTFSERDNDGGTKSAETYYGAYLRVLPNGSFGATQEATLSCEKKDQFSTKEAANGNQSLVYPIGLITADEVLLAGGFGNKANQKYYLYTGNSYWTMSPTTFDNNGASVFVVHSDGFLIGSIVYRTASVRPVINLKADYVKVGSGTGDPGTISNPYEVS